MTDTLPAASSSRSYEEELQKRENIDSDATSSNEFVRSIHIIKNGDIFNPPKRLVVNKRQIRTWETLLEELTLTLKPMHGAIRWIHTPTHGHRLHSLEEIRHEGQYIAVPFGEKLKLHGSNQSLSSKRNGARLEPLKPVEPRRNKAESRILQGPYNQRKIIHVYRNGDEFCRPIHVLLKHFEQKDMEFVLRAVDDRVVLVSSKAIRRLYTMEGKRVKHPEEIEDGRSYVAAGVERFIDCNYGHRLPNLLLGSKRERDKYDGVKFLSQRLTPPKERLSRRTPLSLNDLSQNSSGDTLKRENEYKRQQGYKSAFQKSNVLKKEPKTEPEKQDDMDSETAAAISIQAAYRGYAARKEMKENRPPSASPRPSSHKRSNSSPPSTARIHQSTPPQKPEQHFHRTPTPQSTTDPQDEIIEDEETFQAALKIQSSFRGYRTRRDLKEKQKTEEKPEQISSNKDEHSKPVEDEEAAAIQIQAAIRGYQTRKHLKANQEPQEKPTEKESAKPVEKEKPQIEENKKPTEPEVEETSNKDKEKAAIEIQAAYRGYSTRRKLKQQKEEKEAAVAIQSVYRGYSTRRKLKQQKEEEEAAVAIQSVYRGYRTRKGLQKQQQTTEPIQAAEEIQAAEQIQAAYKGYRTRQSIKEQQQAAEQIQAVYRGYRTRRSLQEQHQAASEIQASYHGYATRRKVKSENEAAAVIQATYRGYKTRKDYLRSKGVSTNEVSVQ